jgi:hypothetical protein
MSLCLVEHSFLVAISENLSLALKSIVCNWGPLCYNFQFRYCLESMMNRFLFWTGNGKEIWPSS